MSCNIAKITVDRYPNGLAVGRSTPSISWRFGGDCTDWWQASYDIKINRGGQVETYHVDSNDSLYIPWPSAPLVSRECVAVSVLATSTTGSSTGWATLDVETALLNRDDWMARVSHGPHQDRDGPKQPFHLRKRFNVQSKRSARLYITALGMYEVSLNGQKVGDHCLAPGWQSYHHRLHYQTFDVTSMLVVGENVIDAHIGEGWYAGRLGFLGGVRNIWGDDLGLIAQLEVGGQVVVETGSEDWEWAYGRTTSSEIYDGEVYDSTVDMDSVAWLPARSAPLPKTHLISPEAPPVRRVLALEAQSIITTPSGKTIVDFGQNLVGWVRLNTEPTGGDGTVVLRHAEVLEHDELGVRPLRICKATDIIKTGGATVKNWEPTFTWHGFRYVEVTGWPDLALSDLTAVVIHSDFEQTGDFSCSHKLINRFHENAVWGARGNFVSVPTDCPQRDERLGWSGDIAVFAPTANFLFDTAGMLGDWLKDLAAEQLNDLDGVVPMVIPNTLRHLGEAMTMAIWGDVSVLTPRDLYHAFGDLRFVQDQYASMVAWLERGIKRRENGLWVEGVQLSDWLDPHAPDDDPGDSITDPMLVADAYLVHVTDAVGRMAKLLGKAAEAEQYTSRADKIRKAWRDEYMTPTGRLSADSQTAYALALFFGLHESDTARAHAADRLDYLIRKEAFKIGTGFAGTPVILHALAENHKLSLAYRMWQEKECPSLLYPVSMGATTIWERWNSMMPDGTINLGEMTSFNHYALGSVIAFLHKYTGGISLLEPGWKKILIAPQPGGTITSAQVYHVSPYGRVACDWTLEGETLRVNIEIPPNCTARVILPGTDEEVGSGQRSYTAVWVADPTWPPKVVQKRFRPEKKDEVVL